MNGQSYGPLGFLKGGGSKNKVAYQSYNSFIKQRLVSVVCKGSGDDFLPCFGGVGAIYLKLVQINLPQVRKEVILAG